MKKRLVVAVLTSLILTSAPAVASEESPKTSVQRLPPTTITVSAAASLSNVFPVIGNAFTKRNPNITVKFNFGPSNGLVEQVRAGAPIDVLATADEASMRGAMDDGLIVRPIEFARNTMMIAVPKGNPAQIRSILDLQERNVSIALCNPQVPCGRLATQVIEKSSLIITPVSRDVDVRGVLGKVIADEVDAGIVYATDVKAFPREVDGIAIPVARNAVTDYPIARVSDSRNPAAADAFVDYVRTSSSAQQILRAWGFSKPW